MSRTPASGVQILRPALCHFIAKVPSLSCVPHVLTPKPLSSQADTPPSQQAVHVRENPTRSHGPATYVNLPSDPQDLSQ
ncbi:hypothetical protein VNO77_19263 [Canavalia gladiata]|uniref:Uncharacterized protein n=1 Tax=Canavalia gladiata TaxID=3824 RepID=A0AAN9LMG0_CANGL